MNYLGVIGYVLLLLGPGVSAIAIIVQATAPEYMRGSDRQLVQLLTLNGAAIALVLVGSGVLLWQVHS